MSMKIVTALFHNRIAADNAVDSLITNGFSRDDVSVLMTETTRGREFGVVDHTKAPEGAVVGGVAGGIAGGVLAAIAATAAIAIPGVGVIVAGPIIAGLAGASVAGAAGGLVGALVGAGIPEHEAKFLSTAIHKGGILVGIRTPSKNVRLAKELLGRYGGESLKAA
jgi:hypothetical protein